MQDVGRSPNTRQEKAVDARASGSSWTEVPAKTSDLLDRVVQLDKQLLTLSMKIIRTEARVANVYYRHWKLLEAYRDAGKPITIEHVQSIESAASIPWISKTVSS